MDKNIILSDEELEMFITSLHCMDERNYNFNARTSIPWSKAAKNTAWCLTPSDIR